MKMPGSAPLWIVTVAVVACIGYWALPTRPDPQPVATGPAPATPTAASAPAAPPPPAPAASASPAAPAAQPPAHPLPPPLHFQDGDFRRLVASPELSDRYKAYGWLKECLNERAFAVMGTEYPRLCGLSDGNVDDIALRKRLAVDLAMHGAFGGVENLIDEGPKGRFRAYADDPAGHAALVAQAMQAAVAQGEPSALASQAGALEAQGDKLHAAGDLEAARAQYVQSLTYSVASALGLARQNGARVDAATDPNVAYALEQFQDRLGAADRQAAIVEGIRLASGWKKS